MTQKTIKSLVLFFAAALFVLNACEKTEVLKPAQERQNEINNPEIKNGVLSFNNKKDLYDLMSDMEYMSQDEFDKWQADMNFSSYKGKLDEIYRKLNSNELNSEKFWKIVDANKKWVKVENDINGEISIRPVIEDMGYAAVLDIDGVCIIDSVALKIIDNFYHNCTKRRY